jgi:hypothetical protein
MAGFRNVEYWSSAKGLQTEQIGPYIMRKRLLVSVAFGAVGLAAAIPVGDQLGLSAPVALVGFGAGGLFIGYALSMFLDIFLSTPSDNTTSEN